MQELWMKKYLQELSFRQDRYVLFCDSHSTIHLYKNMTFHSKSKHIDVRYHWMHDVLSTKALELEKVHTNDNRANMLTKALLKEKLDVCYSIARMVTHSTT